jgi:hypothetical protein
MVLSFADHLIVAALNTDTRQAVPSNATKVAAERLRTASQVAQRALLLKTLASGTAL